MILHRTPCDRHRPALVDFVDHGERGAATEAALQHLERCERCERELSELALTIFALRRTGREAMAVEVPGADRPPVVPADAGDRRLHPLRRLGIPAGALAFVLVAGTLGLAGLRSGSGETASTRSPIETSEDRLAEAGFLSAVRGLPRPSGEVASVVTLNSRQYPDGIRPSEKEVQPGEAPGRSPVAI